MSTDLPPTPPTSAPPVFKTRTIIAVIAAILFMGFCHWGAGQLRELAAWGRQQEKLAQEAKLAREAKRKQAAAAEAKAAAVEKSADKSGSESYSNTSPEKSQPSSAVLAEKATAQKDPATATLPASPDVAKSGGERTVNPPRGPPPVVQPLPSAVAAVAKPPVSEKPAIPEKAEPGQISYVIPTAVIRDFGRVVYKGPVDLSPTIERIRKGERTSHRNDGVVFENRERRLPVKAKGYYHEYVHPTAEINGAGPQRVVLGLNGEIYYTPDHYESFVRVTP